MASNIWDRIIKLPTKGKSLESYTRYDAGIAASRTLRAQIGCHRRSDLCRGQRAAGDGARVAGRGQPGAGHLHADGCGARRRHLHQLGVHERLYDRRAFSGSGRCTDGFPRSAAHGGVGDAGATGRCDPGAGGVVQARLHRALCLQRGDDRLSQRHCRAHHPGAAWRPDRLSEPLLQQRGARPGSGAAARPGLRADHHHRLIDAGVGGLGLG